MSTDQANHTPQEITQHIAHALLEKKGEEVLIMNMQGLYDSTDYFVLATGISNRHLITLHDHILEHLHQQCREKPFQVAGTEEALWIVLDYTHVVVHLFLPDTRERYALEDLWGDAIFRRVADPLAEETLPPSTDISTDPSTDAPTDPAITPPAP